MDKYTVVARIWHTGDECYYEAGDNVTMTHLTDSQIERLVAAGVIEPLRDKRKEQEAIENGDIDSTEHQFDGSDTELRGSSGGR